MEGSGEGIVREFGINMYVQTVIFKITKTYYIAQGTLLNVI